MKMESDKMKETHKNLIHLKKLEDEKIRKIKNDDKNSYNFLNTLL